MMNHTIHSCFLSWDWYHNLESSDHPCLCCADVKAPKYLATLMNWTEPVLRHEQQSATQLLEGADSGVCHWRTLLCFMPYEGNNSTPDLVTSLVQSCKFPSSVHSTTMLGGIWALILSCRHLESSLSWSGTVRSQCPQCVKHSREKMQMQGENSCSFKQEEQHGWSRTETQELLDSVCVGNQCGMKDSSLVWAERWVNRIVTDWLSLGRLPQWQLGEIKNFWNVS